MGLCKVNEKDEYSNDSWQKALFMMEVKPMSEKMTYAERKAAYLKEAEQLFRPHCHPPGVVGQIFWLFGISWGLA
jgi:hypothetical protein